MEACQPVANSILWPWFAHTQQKKNVGKLAPLLSVASSSPALLTGKEMSSGANSVLSRTMPDVFGCLGRISS